ncbi:hypothetical protein [Xenorhabdus griffiniae]|uniref:hypothetical protein n=1 Tax=Xenorhabdus griffiniae TaxID=351672 RepID=UPI00235901E2|nr:hypothetical protein [Xenorhabdus griffiniae]MDC9607297.1 hypothetical protein [Xenorhabdus griffiniae]
MFLEYKNLRNKISEIAIRRLQKRCLSRYGCCFYGYNNNINGLLNAIISTTRILPLDDARKILNFSSDYDINMIVNDLFRPEIRIPRIFVAEQGTYQQV